MAVAPNPAATRACQVYRAIRDKEDPAVYREERPSVRIKVAAVRLVQMVPPQVKVLPAAQDQ
jgi:hypothetical protein